MRRMFEIGNSLREARLRRHIEFADAEHGTKIRGKYLRALEDERFELLPSHTYIKGFLRSYAEYLGLDGQLYVDEYNSRFVVGEEDGPVRSPRRVPAARARRKDRRESNFVLLGLLAIAVFTRARDRGLALRQRAERGHPWVEHDSQGGGGHSEGVRVRPAGAACDPRRLVHDRPVAQRDRQRSLPGHAREGSAPAVRRQGALAATRDAAERAREAERQQA